MKKFIFNFIFCFFLSLTIFFLFKNNKEVSNIILSGINLFFTKVFVSLFPMFIINDLLISANVPYYFYLIFNNLFKKVFKTSGVGSYVFIMSLVSGTPSNAYILKTLVEENVITNPEASHFLYFTYFSNPLFLTLMLFQIFPTNIVFKIIIAHYLANVIIGLLVRNKAPEISDNKITFSKNNIGSALIKSINRSMSTLLMILGTLVFYMLLSYIITNIFKMTLLFKVLISGFLEITNGLNMLNSLNILLKIKEIIAVSIISFGGLSINTQIKGILEDTQINYNCFLKGRLLQVLISTLIIIFI